jgi:class 3 adenylate cyclase
MGETRVENTVLFADIAGSTRMYEEVGDEKGRELLVACLDGVAEVVERGGGTVIDRIGDELMCTFADPSVAAQTAQELQRINHQDDGGPEARPLRLRIGFEHGPLIETDQGIFGNTVHTAARLATLAKAGQTLTTRQTLDRIIPPLRMFARLFDRVMLKGIPGEQEIHELPWNTQSTMKRPSARAGRRAHTGIEVSYGDDSRRVDAMQPRLEIGKDVACDLRVEGLYVSGLHARVVWDGGRAHLEDVSTNGTRIEPDEGAPSRVHHERLALEGAGRIRLGDPDDETEGATLNYRVF